MHCSWTANLVRGKKKSVGGKMRYLFIVKNMSVFKTILKQLLFFFLCSRSRAGQDRTSRLSGKKMLDTENQYAGV